MPFTPSLVAVIVAAPATTPVTSPPGDTVATPRALLVQVITRPVNGVPLTSLGVALSCTVCPATTLAAAGLTVTEATGTGVPVVVPLATFETAPNTASTFSVPRNATSWN